MAKRDNKALVEERARLLELHEQKMNVKKEEINKETFEEDWLFESIDC